MMAQERFSLEDAERICKMLGLSRGKIHLKQFQMGLNIELEHGRRNPSLSEFPDYYSRLEKLEKAAEAYWKK